VWTTPLNTYTVQKMDLNLHYQFWLDNQHKKIQIIMKAKVGGAGKDLGGAGDAIKVMMANDVMLESLSPNPESKFKEMVPDAGWLWEEQYGAYGWWAV
jgi:hypothetical protein